ncbi:hypothetical protein SMKI_09G1690 [Saccharomyces mikatae IFO 1815]|uniref:Altered inheritance of mitochondria protein 21 n=1 Tax=Saccharomyces mikatae IFO 1815 TaxID=226126 RepID=A0AA35J0A1_SACMI|nr:uncharacterized protein SMKI_09G1690 [Saccharomyces mikatae IFO 1815]CAI4039759.1 hypothetical protein SMKI_09G1690 [Saccharomyces mikatae IFO 1815]
MSSEDVPKIPERPSRRKTSELFPSPSTEAGDIKANSEPSTPLEKPNVPTRRPILKAKTMTSFECGTVPENLPQVPLQRPIRRSTTEELNNVMNNTSKELKEIESLITKHNTHYPFKKKSSTAVREGETAAIHQSEQRSLSDKDSFSPDLSLSVAKEHEKNEDSQPAVSSSNLLKSSHDEIAKGSDLKGRTEKQEVHTALDNEVGDRSGFEKGVTSEDVELPVDVDKEVEEDSVQSSGAATGSGVKAEKFTKLSESSFEELQKHQEQQEEKIFQNPTDEESTTSLNEKLEAENNLEVNRQPNRLPAPAKITQTTGTNIHSQSQGEQANDIPVIPRSRPKKDLQAGLGKEESFNVENKPTPEEHDSTHVDAEEKSEIPKVPSERPKRRAPPPVPKKPSSRIAAFQEMLQKQQQQDLHNNGISSAITASADTTKENTESSTASNSTNADFTNKLNGLLALPGMVNPGQLPASLGKRLSSSDAEPTGGKQEQPQAKGAPLGNIRRTKGPRGRKLPSKVADVEKVEEDENTNKIEIFNNWNVHFLCSKQRILANTNSNEQLEKTLDENSKNIPMGQSEVSSNEVGDALYPIVMEEKNVSTANAESVPDFSLSQTAAVGNRKTASEESLSPSDAIANRDQDDITQIQEQQMENQMEADMARELSDGYEDVDYALHSEEASTP